MWSDVVRTDNSSSGNSRCHSLSTSYALGDITPITFLCLHKITHLRSKWMWRSSQENSTGSDMKQWPGRPFCSSAARSRSRMCPKVWLTWKPESLKTIQGHLSPNPNEVSKERKTRRKKRRKKGKKEGRKEREGGRKGRIWVSAEKQGVMPSTVQTVYEFKLSSLSSSTASYLQLQNSLKIEQVFSWFTQNGQGTLFRPCLPPLRMKIPKSCCRNIEQYFSMLHKGYRKHSEHA